MLAIAPILIYDPAHNIMRYQNVNPTVNIQIRNLRSFIAIASAGSISKAAKMIHIAQPALSAHVQQIEETLGTAVFERVHRGVTLTPAGERFLRHAEEILRHIDTAVSDVRNAVSKPSGKVSLGLPQSMARLLGVPLVKAVVERWPQVQLQLVEMNTGYIPESLLTRKIDLGMTFRQEDDMGVVYKHLLDEELVFVSSPRQMTMYQRGRRRKSASIQASDLPRFPIIMPTIEHSLRRRIEECLQIAKIKLNVIAEVNAIPQLIELAEAGVGSTILSRAAAEHDSSSKGLLISSIVQPAMVRPVYLCRASAFPMSIAGAMISDLVESLVTGTGRTSA